MRRVDGAQRTDVHQSFRHMYEATLADVYGFLSLRVGGSTPLAEDLTAETYTAALRHYNAGRAHEVTIAWLITVARRRLIDHWRKEATRSKVVVRLAPPGVVESDDWVDHEAVGVALARLSRDHRTVLVLQHIEGYTVAEIADLLDRSTKATESLLARARQAFRSVFEEATDV